MTALLCLLTAVVLAALSTAGNPQHPRWHRFSAALLFVVLALLAGQLP